jgi:hypothetical protein
VLDVNLEGELSTRSTAPGIALEIPAVDLWTTRLRFKRALGMAASTECYHEAWR